MMKLKHWQTNEIRLLHIMRNLELPGNQKNIVDNTAERTEQIFYSLGHFDQMVYVRSVLMPFDYKHCFAIKYPYTGFKENVDLDQVLCLVPLKEFQEQEDPFEYNKGNLPFLTLSLISVDSYPLSNETDNFENVVDQICISLTELLNKYRERQQVNFVGQVFYSLNCADLCIAIRSDRLQDCYMLSRSIRMMKENGFTLNTTTLFFSCLTHDLSSSYREKIVQRNADVEIALRLGLTSDQVVEGVAFELFQSGAHGILGTGNLSINLKLKEYLEIYPFLYGSKFKREKVIQDFPQHKFPSAFIKKIRDGDLQITVIHERVLFLQTNESVVAPRKICENLYDQNPLILKQRYSEIAHKYIKAMQEKVEEIDRYQYRIPYEAYRYAENIRLIRDLCYTFDDLWFQKESGINGYLFYSQMFLLIDGVKKQWNIINALIELPVSENSEDAEKASDAINESGKPISRSEIVAEMCKTLVDTMHQAIVGINNHNKIMQAYNLPSVNTPSYEVQSKVHTEQYLAAYTAYLQMICANFYQNEGSKCNVSIPIVSLDINATKLKAYSLFGPVTPYYSGSKSVIDALGKDNNEIVTLVTVICPNYQRFANAFHVLPLVTHEISHNFRYIPRKDRNEFLIQYVFQKLSQRIVKWLDLTNDITTGTLQRELADVIKNQLVDHFRNFCGKPWIDECLMKDFPLLFDNYFINVLHIPNQDNYTVKSTNLWADIKERFVNLMSLASFFPIFPEASGIEHLDVGKLQSIYISIVFQSLCNMERSNQARVRQEQDEWINCLNIQMSKISDANREEIRIILNFLREISTQHDSSEKKISINYLNRAFLLICRLCYSSIFQEHNKWMAVLYRSNENPVFRKAEEVTLRKSILTDTDISILREELRHKVPCDGEDAREFHYCIEHLCTQLESVWIDGSVFLSLLKNAGPQIIFYPCSPIEELANGIYYQAQKVLDHYAKEGMAGEWMLPSNLQDIFMQIGLLRQNPKYFRATLLRMFQVVNTDVMMKFVRDDISLYDEVFADLGMCAAFDMSSFGYLRFTLHIFSQERSTGSDFARDFTIDRILVVLYALISEHDENLSHVRAKLAEYYRNFIQAFCDWAILLLEKHDNEDTQVIRSALDLAQSESMRLDNSREYISFISKDRMEWIGRHLNLFCEKSINNRCGMNLTRKKLGSLRQEALYYLMHINILIRMRKVDVALQKQESMDQCIKERSDSLVGIVQNSEIVKHCKEIFRERIQNANWVQTVKRDSTISEIGQYYNNSQCVNLQNSEDSAKDIRRNRLYHQVNFILKYYWKSRNYYARIIRENLQKESNEDPVPMEEWIKEVGDYFKNA